MAKLDNEMKLPVLWVLFKTTRDNMTFLYGKWQMQNKSTGCAVVYITVETSLRKLVAQNVWNNKTKKCDHVVMSHRGSNAPQEN